MVQEEGAEDEVEEWDVDGSAEEQGEAVDREGRGELSMMH